MAFWNFWKYEYSECKKMEIIVENVGIKEKNDCGKPCGKCE